ncbi:hypothetical protein SAMN05880558_12421 [Aeromonas sp. RU39B]|uniref:PA3496 family putative envelope integrity protein n=1 Tax=Aeromonas sp. RU39B TaxID=1907416 RepID=UPI0009568928|nr:hypothetical protein [Aeromonas sp. RU39B]SIR65816.1 hypothetical protein SAMN05880558_12421 [Aeromonas sp. RU39B]
MKPLTEAQVMGYRGSIPPRTPQRYDVEREPTAAEKRSAKQQLKTRRAIEEYNEQRALRLAMEL